MVAAISAEASAHLHLDPSLKVKGRCRSCAPGWSGKVLCCFISCCNTQRDTDVALYCDKTGRCMVFDWDNTDDSEARVQKTAQRIGHLVSEVKPLDDILSETGIDLVKKAEEGAAITLEEFEIIQRVI